MTIGNRLPSLRANIVAMTVVQFSNYILPLVALPYLARVLGPEAFGKVVLAQVVMTYFVLLVDYGFSWSATRKIAVLRTDRVRLSRLFMATWTAQWLLVLLAFALATSIVMSNDRLRLDAPLYAAAFAVVIGTPLAPFWFLQGLERLQAVAALQLITRTLALLPIFVLVKQPGDAIWVLITQASGTILGGALALIWIYREAIIIWHTPTWHETLHELADGWTLFRSRAAISLYTSLVPLVLGWVAGPVALAHFNMADKLRSAAQSLLTPLSQALFPRMSHLVSTDSNAADSLIRRSAVAVMFIAGTASATLWLFADHLIHFLGGQDFLPASDVLRWLSPLPLIIGLSNLLGIQVMLPRGLHNSFNKIVLSAAAASVVIIWPMTYHNQATGAAQTMLIVEILVTTSMAVLLARLGHLTNRKWRKT